jgi:uncharacterized membrane protein HdeD (DUF308 family)
VGILAIVIGLMSIAWPGVTILVLVTLFAAYASISTGQETLRGFSVDKAALWAQLFPVVASRPGVADQSVAY